MVKAAAETVMDQEVPVPKKEDRAWTGSSFPGTDTTR